MCTPTQGVWQPAGCVSCELVCVCVSLVRVVIICLASTHTALPLVSSPSLDCSSPFYLPTSLFFLFFTALQAMLGRRRPSQIGEPAAPAVAHVRNAPMFTFFFAAVMTQLYPLKSLGTAPAPGYAARSGVATK